MAGYGNYNLAPQVVSPKNSPMRFYRILDEGQDSLIGDEPTVMVDVLTNGTIASGELVFTSQPQPISRACMELFCTLTVKKCRTPTAQRITS